jgi:predicted nucleotidyltransferase
MDSRKMNIDVRKERIDAFCQKWGLKELSLFGSVLRNDFRPDSDVDVLVTFLPGRQMTFDSFIEMQDELSAMFVCRIVVLVQK